MKNFVFGIVFGILVVILAAYLFVITGGMPVPTRSKPLPFEKFVARRSIHIALKGHIDTPSPLPASEENLEAGAKVYLNQCAACHGLPNSPASDIAKGMFPPPPHLMPPKKGVTDDPVGATHWLAQNGIRMTGMPGFGDLLSQDEIWQVSLFLKNADKLSPKILNMLQPAQK